MRAAAIALVLASGCGSSSKDEVRGYGYGAEVVECFDDACRIIEGHLAELRAEEITYYQAVSRILALGERAVPTLRRELAAESVLHVRVSAYVLTALGHVDEVNAWCNGLGRERDGRDLACARQ